MNFSSFRNFYFFRTSARTERAGSAWLKVCEHRVCVCMSAYAVWMGGLFKKFSIIVIDSESVALFPKNRLNLHDFLNVCIAVVSGCEIESVKCVYRGTNEHEELLIRNQTMCVIQQLFVDTVRLPPTFLPLWCEYKELI